MRRRRIQRKNPSTPQGTIMAVAALAGIGTSLYYSFSAMSPSASTEESTKRAMIGGGLLIGSIGLIAFGGQILESMGMTPQAA